MAIDASGKIVVAGRCDGIFGRDFALARYNSDGSLDTGFDADGKVTTNFAGGDSAYGVAIGTDGKIVLAGTNGGDFALARYDNNGGLDSTFGAAGKVATDFDSGSDVAWDMAFDTAGNIVVAGYSYKSTIGYDFALARYNSNGSLDTSFDDDGKVTADFGSSSDYAYGVAINAGKIVVAGNSDQGGSNGYDFALARYNSDGSPDTEFDGDGKLTTDFGSSSDYARGVAVDGDGKVVVGGYSYQGDRLLGGTENDFALARYNSDGSLDTTFDGDGKVTTNIGNPGTVDRGLPGVAVQPDGKIVVVGSSDQGGSNGNDFAVARFNSDGTLDTSFDGDGRVTTDFGSPGQEYAVGVAVDGDGKILVVGQSDQGTSHLDFALARYNTDGSLDTTFDGDGKVTTDFGSSYDRADGVAIDADGKIVVAGSSNQDSSRAHFALARYNTDGSLDTTFDGDGKVITDLGGFPDVGNCVTIDGEGKIVVGGYAVNYLPTGYDFALARYNTNGSLDTSFGAGGKVITDFGLTMDLAWDMAIDGAGKIVLAGYAYEPTEVPFDDDYDFALARYNSDGSVDTAFGTAGKVTTDLGSPRDGVSGIAIQADNQIVVAGFSGRGGSNDSDFALARYNGSDGSLDTTFGTGGIITTDFNSSSDQARSVAIDGNGKIVVAGSSDNDFALARYEADFGVAPVTAPADAVDVDTEMAVSAVFTDQDLTHTHTATWEWGDGTTSPGDVTEPSSPGLVTGSHTYAAGGVYTITLTVTVNETGDSDQSVVQDVVVRRPVQIDVKPGSDLNPVNLTAQGLIAVAILTNDSFDAAWVDVSSVVFAGAHAVHSTMEDTDGDGDLDLVLHFEIQETNLADVYAQLVADDLNGDGILDSNHQTTAVSLTGETAADEYFQGFDDMDLFLSGKNLRDFLEDLATAGAI